MNGEPKNELFEVRPLVLGVTVCHLKLGVDQVSTIERERGRIRVNRVFGGSSGSLKLALDHAAHELVRADLVEVVKRNSEAGVVERVRVAAFADQQLGIGHRTPLLHRVQRYSPRQDVEHHHRQALGVRYPRLSVSGAMMFDNLWDPQSTQDGADEGKVPDRPGFDVDVWFHSRGSHVRGNCAPRPVSDDCQVSIIENHALG